MLKKLCALAIPMTLLFGAGAFACDQENTFTSVHGHKLIDCRIEGGAALSRYQSLASPIEEVRDPESGQLTGYRKQDAYNYCFTDVNQEVFECSQTLDGGSRAVLPLSAALN